MTPCALALCWKIAAYAAFQITKQVRRFPGSEAVVSVVTPLCPL